VCTRAVDLLIKEQEAAQILRNHRPSGSFFQSRIDIGFRSVGVRAQPDDDRVGRILVYIEVTNLKKDVARGGSQPMLTS